MALPFLFAVVPFILLCKSIVPPCESTPVDISDSEVCQTPICHESAQFLLDSMDTSVDPCDDFYQYACGGWIEKHSIPKGKDSISTFEALIDQVNDNVVGILKNASNENHTEAVLNAAILYRGCIDEEAREMQGLNPLRNLLNSHGGWPMVNEDWSEAGYEWYTQVATLRRTLGIDAIVSIKVDADRGDPSRYVVSIAEPAFGLRNKYLKDLNITEKNREIINRYRSHIIATAKLINPNIDETQLGNDADDIIQFESDLLQANYSVGEYVTVSFWYKELMEYILHKITKGSLNIGVPVSEVQKVTENEYFSWTDFLNNVFQDFPQVTDKTKIHVGQSQTYIRHAIKVTGETDPRIVANYIGWTLVRNIGQHTTKDMRDNKFRFQQMLENYAESEEDQNVEGEEEEEKDTPEPEKLERTCAQETVKLLGFAVGRLYVDKFLSEEAKRDVEALIEDIRSAYELNFIHNEWMDPDTKSKALEKLRAMVNLVAYPEWIKNDIELNDYYQAVQGVKEDEYFASWVKAKGVAESKTLMKWNQNAHRATDWNDYPPVVNAYYYSLYNTMTFPAGIINPPVYIYGRLPTLNHAGIGSIVAHEISHGFDNSGSRFNKEGKYENWWSKETLAKFENKTECFVKQYSSFVDPISNMSLKGYQTLGDDIADNGGLRNAFMAYKLQVLQAQENEVHRFTTRLPGVSATVEQLFFLMYATMYCSNETKKSMKSSIEGDVHSPGRYRTIVPLSNSRAFAEAFNCPVGSRMNPEIKCHLW